MDGEGDGDPRAFLDLVEAAPVAVAVLQDGAYVYANPETSRMLGYDRPRGVEGLAMSTILAPDSCDALAARASATLRGESNAPGVFRLLRRDGTEVVAESASVPVSFRGRPATLVVGKDVTEHAKAQEALRQSELHMQDVLDATSDMVIRLDPDLRVVWANRAAADSLGRTSPDLLRGHRCHELWYDRSEPCPRCPVRGAFERGTPCEGTLRTRDGRVWYARAWPHREPSGTVASVTEYVIEVTDRERKAEEGRRLEARLRETGRLESLGAVAGGVAHDFNNLLAVILGNADLLDGAGALVPEQSQALVAIRTAAVQAAELCRQMLTYAGRQSAELRPLDVGVLVRGMEAVLRGAVPRALDFDLELGSDLPRVAGDPARLRQVLMNLTLNAAEAQEGRPGRVRVSLGVVDGSVVPEGFHCFGRPEAGRPWVRLEVADEGRGIDPSTMERLFDPFFSTKFTGRGLGLAVVLGVVRAHGGAIEVDSAVGAGTRFRVYLPAVEEPPAAASPEREAAAVPTGDESAALSGTVLVVDDDAMVRDVAARMLEGMGLTVVRAASGAEALARLGGLGTDLVLVLLDLTMPRMDGVATLQALRAAGCAVPILLMSGYHGDDVARRLSTHAVAGILGKPFKLDAFETLVRRTMGTSPGEDAPR